MFYEIEVRPAPGMDFFQYYTVTVEAQTRHDALQRVQRSNPGCMLSCCGSYQSRQGSEVKPLSPETKLIVVAIAILIGIVLLINEAIIFLQSSFIGLIRLAIHFVDTVTAWGNGLPEWIIIAFVVGWLPVLVIVFEFLKYKNKD